jgi:hypothetical protein
VLREAKGWVLRDDIEVLPRVHHETPNPESNALIFVWVGAVLSLPPLDALLPPQGIWIIGFVGQRR